MRNTNWNRQYRFEATGSDGRSFVLGQEKAQNGNAIHISFQFEKDETYCYNRAVFDFWNLSDYHLSILDDRSCKCVLYGGYGNDMPMLFQGYVLNVKTVIDGGDRNTSLEIADTFGQMSDAYVSLSYEHETSTAMIVDDIASKLDVPMVLSEGAAVALSMANMPEGYSCVGKASEALTTLFDSCGLRWSIQDGTLQVVKQGEAKTNYRNEMSNATGLIGIPERVYKSSSVSSVNDYNTRSEEIYGYRIRYFMDGTLGIHDVIHLVTDKVSGDFFIYQVNVSGDNLSGDWTCTAEVCRLTDDYKTQDKTPVLD